MLIATEMGTKKHCLLHMFMIFLCIPLCTLQISEKDVETFLKGIEIVDEQVKIMYDILSQDNHITPEDVIVALFETVPLIGTIVHIFRNDDINTQKIILGKLEQLLERQDDVIQELSVLQKKVDLLVTNNHITISTKSITSCSDDRKAFLRNPNQIPEQNLMVNWYFNIMTDNRFLVRVLTEKETSLPKLFQNMIYADGFCNSSKIISSYKYFLGYVIEGCECAIIAEQLKYNGSSTLFLQECKTSIASISQHLGVIFRNCTSDSCAKIRGILKSRLKSSLSRDTDRLLTEISDTLPWFNFSVLAFKSNPNLQIIGNLLPSYNAFYTKDFYLLILWTKLETSGECVVGDSFTGFALQFNPEKFINASFAMKVNKNINSNTAYIISYITNDSSSTYKACANSEVDLDASSGINTIAPTILFVSFLILIAVNIY